MTTTVKKVAPAEGQIRFLNPKYNAVPAPTRPEKNSKVARLLPPRNKRIKNTGEA